MVQGVTIQLIFHKKSQMVGVQDFIYGYSPDPFSFIQPESAFYSIRFWSARLF